MIQRLFPKSNQPIMQQPEYWYEDQIIRFFAEVHSFIVARIVEIVYWADFELKEKSYLYLGTLGIAVHLAVIGIYYYLWVFYYNYALPLPFNFYFGHTIAYFVMGIATWPRFVDKNIYIPSKCLHILYFHCHKSLPSSLANFAVICTIASS